MYKISIITMSYMDGHVQNVGKITWSPKGVLGLKITLKYSGKRQFDGKMVGPEPLLTTSSSLRFMPTICNFFKVVKICDVWVNIST